MVAVKCVPERGSALGGRAAAIQRILHRWCFSHTREHVKNELLWFQFYRKCTSHAHRHLALTLKHGGDFTHYLVETNDDKTVKLKDAVTRYPSLAALLFHHCIEADGSCVGLDNIMAGTINIVQDVHVCCGRTSA